MGYQSEAQLEEQLIKKLRTQQYIFKKIDDYEALEDNFREQIEKFNADVLDTPLTDAEFSRIINYLCGKTVFTSAKQLRDQFILERDDGTKQYIRFLSENPDENIYQVTNQVSVENKYKNRYDVSILINGLPLVQIELKRSGIDINEAINQINRYKLHSYKGLFHYIQIFIVSNSVETRYFSNTDETRFLKSLTFYWTDERNNRICNLDDFSTAFLDRNRLVKMFTRYMVLSESEKNLMVMRPYQVYATEAVVRRALETDKGGFVWHTTGERVIIVIPQERAVNTRASAA
nr:type I restriction endonuclease [uncultured Schaedlerella sp.]